jgi:DnaJ domain
VSTQTYQELPHAELGKFHITRFSCGHFNSRLFGLGERHSDDWSRYPHYAIWLDDYEKLNNKRAFAKLRKAIKAYRHASPWWYVDADHTETGDMWVLHEQTLLHFADCFEFDAPLDNLMAEARVSCAHLLREQEKRKAEWQRAHEEERRWWHAAFGDYHDNFFHSGFFSGMPYGSHSNSKVDKALKVFGLSRPVTQEDIKRKYRALAKQHHPDTGGDAEYFKRVSKAYQVLQNFLSDSA